MYGFSGTIWFLSFNFRHTNLFGAGKLSKCSFVKLDLVIDTSILHFFLKIVHLVQGLQSSSILAGQKNEVHEMTLFVQLRYSNNCS